MAEVAPPAASGPSSPEAATPAVVAVRGYPDAGGVAAPHTATPLVSVLMPTFRQALFLPRALRSLLDQQLPDWELLVVDDASPDETPAVLTPFLGDARIRAVRLDRNVGTGAALNLATSLARGRYVAYLPSDDVFFPDHLQRLVDHLEGHPDVYLAYGGLRWGPAYRGPTLHGEGAVGGELAALSRPYPRAAEVGLPSGNLLALVQVAHRREWEGEVRWATRDEAVTDRLEADFWRALLTRGARFAYSGAVTCHWVDHPDQQHKIVGWGRIDNGPGAVLGVAGRGARPTAPTTASDAGSPSTGAPPPGATSTNATPTPGSRRAATRPHREGREVQADCASSWPASWASTPSASWPSRNGGTRSSASGCATPSSGTQPALSPSGTSRRSPFRAIGRSGCRPPART